MHCWASAADGTIHTAARDQALGWKPPTMVEDDDIGNWVFSDSGVPPAFDLDEYWPSDDSSGSDSEYEHEGGNQTRVIVTANGDYRYDEDWGGVGSARDPERAACKLLHIARQMVDTSRWWTMQWPINAISLMGRVGKLGTAHTYDLIKNLRNISVDYLEQLWRVQMERRHERDHGEQRDALREDWQICKRRLGATGRNRKRQLMPAWATVSSDPVYRIKWRLRQWQRVTSTTIAPNGQRTLDIFVCRTARDRLHLRSTTGARTAPEPRSRVQTTMMATRTTGSQEQARQRLQVHRALAVTALRAPKAANVRATWTTDMQARERIRGQDRRRSDNEQARRRATAAALQPHHRTIQPHFPRQNPPHIHRRTALGRTR